MPHLDSTPSRAAVLVLALLAAACGGGTEPTTPVAPPASVASVTVAPSTLSLTVGGATGTLTATAVSGTGATIGGKTPVWTSSNAAVATVAGGVVTPVSGGSAIITADVDGRTATAAVSVATPLPSLLEVVAGNGQRGITGRALADSIVVRARKADGTPAAGVSLAMSASGGTLSATTATTDASGLARLQWVAGSGAATASVSMAGSASLELTSTGLANGACTLNPAGQRMTLGATDFTLSLRATAAHKIAVLFVDFSDAPSTALETPDSLDRLIVKPGLALLNELSYGKVQIATTLVPKWYRMSKTSNSYTWNTYDGHKAYIAEAMGLADADVDFSQYDAVYILTPASVQQSISPTFNGGQSGGITVDGKVFGNGVTFGRDSRLFGAAILAHETGHMFGLVDLYSFDPAAGSPYTGNQFRDIGAWSIMSNTFVPAHTLAWEKRKLGFLDATQTDCLDAANSGEEVVVQPVEVPGGLKLVALQLDASRAIAIEVRSLQGMDAKLCADGVLIYDVNAAAASGVDPAKIRGSRVTTSGSAYSKCGPWADATYGVGTGNIDTFTDAVTGVSVKVLAAEANGAYRIRVKR